MSFIERLNDSPITNIPELVNWHHSNPLGINPLGLLIFIFIIAAFMELVNFQIRYRDKAKFYPILYTLFGITLVSIYYYCFMADLPTVDRYGEKPCIGWFCDYDVVGDWGLTILGLVGLVLVVYWMICAVMQVTAQMSVHAGLSEGKKWKEWKWGNSSCSRRTCSKRYSLHCKGFGICLLVGIIRQPDSDDTFLPC
ncbi:MAG: hypothetical protein II554_00545 [Bacteroidales bacterium]|nr:hypothetical protein [Bacteroidales bacterium]